MNETTRRLIGIPDIREVLKQIDLTHTNRNECCYTSYDDGGKVCHCIVGEILTKLDATLPKIGHKANGTSFNGLVVDQNQPVALRVYGHDFGMDFTNEAVVLLTKLQTTADLHGNSQWGTVVEGELV